MRAGFVEVAVAVEVVSFAVVEAAPAVRAEAWPVVVVVEVDKMTFVDKMAWVKAVDDLAGNWGYSHKLQDHTELVGEQVAAEHAGLLGSHCLTFSRSVECNLYYCVHTQD